MDLNGRLTDWNHATASLDPGVQRVFIDTLTLVADEEISLTYGADYRHSSPCLVNAVATMLTKDENGVRPSYMFREVVSAFDSINRELEVRRVNTAETSLVSPLAAEILLANFGTVKDMPEITQVETETERIVDNAEFANPDIAAPYREPSDEYFAKDLMAALTQPAPEPTPEVIDPEFQAALKASIKAE